MELQVIIFITHISYNMGFLTYQAKVAVHDGKFGETIISYSMLLIPEAQLLDHTIKICHTQNSVCRFENLSWNFTPEETVMEERL